MVDETWWSIFNTNRGAYLKLFCFPYAGGELALVIDNRVEGLLMTRHIRRPRVCCARRSALSLRQHDSTGERGELTIGAGEVRLYSRRLCHPDAPECPATAAR
jgi:hypothetical protein